MDEFFKDWYYGKGFPIYTTQWKQDNGQLELVIEQTSSDPSVYFFNIPLPFQLHSNSWDSTLVVDPSFSGQKFTIPIAKSLDSIVFDPEDWILAKHDFITSSNNWILGSPKLQIYPNPTQGSVNINFTQILHSDQIRVENVNGINQKIEVNNNNLSLNKLPKGLYIIRIQLDNELIIKKVILR